MPFSGMWHRIVLVWTDVSEDRIASIFTVEKFSSEELHGATSHKTAFFIVTAVKTSNLTKNKLVPCLWLKFVCRLYSFVVLLSSLTYKYFIKNCLNIFRVQKMFMVIKLGNTGLWLLTNFLAVQRNTQTNRHSFVFVFLFYVLLGNITC
jgi:hypothetical protein